MFQQIELVLFTNDAFEAAGMVNQGINNFLIDWEKIGKDIRQRGYDTEIRPGTLNDLRAIAAIPNVVTWCRLNPFGEHTEEEIERALDAHVNILLLPMVETVQEVEAFLKQVAERCLCGILIETTEALTIGKELACLPIDYVYFGLNDFAISRGDHTIFQAVLDNSVAYARDIFWRQRFGFGGLTDVSKGYPVPSLSLLKEMARLKCDYSFLRRSFRNDLRENAAAQIVTELQTEWQSCMARDSNQIQQDRIVLESYLNGL